MEQYLQVGVISSTHGLKGEVKVFPTTDDAARFKKFKKIILDTGSEKLTLEIQSVRFFKKLVILKFKDLNHINDVERYRGKSLLIDRAHAAPLQKDEYFVVDMIGIKVYTDDNQEFGILTEVMATGANDVYVIASIDYGDVLIPAIKDCIIAIDIEQKKMIVHLLDGLI